MFRLTRIRLAVNTELHRQVRGTMFSVGCVLANDFVAKLMTCQTKVAKLP